MTQWPLSGGDRPRKELGFLDNGRGRRANEQLALLRFEGCTEAQGYLLRPPRPAEDVESMLSKGRARFVALAVEAR
jgi:hypothetical protein